LKIHSAKLDDNNQTLVLATDSHPQAVTYALTIPGVKAKEEKMKERQLIWITI